MERGGTGGSQGFPPGGRGGRSFPPSANGEKSERNGGEERGYAIEEERARKRVKENE